MDAMRTTRLLKEEREALRKEKKCFHCKKEGHFARDCWSKTKEKGKQKDKEKAPLSRVRQAKVKKVVDGWEGSDDKMIAPLQNKTPPSYSKGDDIAAAIWSITTDKRESLLELLAAEGF